MDRPPPAAPLPSYAGVAPVLTRGQATWLVVGLSMIQPLSTDLYLPTLPGIASAFDAAAADVQWTLSAFIATFGVWQLVAGPMSDRYGRRPVILLGAMTYGFASLLCMAAPSIVALVCGRMLQAIGACTSLVGVRGMVRDPTRRSKARACLPAPRPS